MINIFQCPYDQRLQTWYELRKKLTGQDTKTIAIEVDKWWQQTPLVNHYLHPDFVNQWPDPWELIHENTYCTIARGLGMVYTLHLLGINKIDFVEAKDYNNEDVVLVLVEDAKYILNYWPNTVVNNILRDFTVKQTIDISELIRKIK
jgi:hypothetical protein